MITLLEDERTKVDFTELILNDTNFKEKFIRYNRNFNKFVPVFELVAIKGGDDDTKKSIDIYKQLKESPSYQVQKLLNRFIPHIIKNSNDSEEAKEYAQKINNIFVYNNVPTVGKIFEAFKLIFTKNTTESLNIISNGLKLQKL
jgi:hypothetical protein